MTLPAASTPQEIHVSAAIVADAEGRALLVRKRGTTRFMQPGGKPEPGETPADTIRRELAEEVGLVVEAHELAYLGVFRADAANEPGLTVVAEVFAVTAAVSSEQVQAAAEIDELRWLAETEETAVPLAPLSDLLLPLAWARTA